MSRREQSKETRRTRNERKKRQLRASSVFVRIRPNLEEDEGDGQSNQILKGSKSKSDDNNNNVAILGPSMKQLQGWDENHIKIRDRHGVENYSFPAKVIDPSANQEEMYEEMKLPELVDQFVDGYNVLFFAYGQTGTGKTHSIFGPERSLESSSSLDSKQWGIFPRVVQSIFSAMKQPILRTDNDDNDDDGGRQSEKKYILMASALEFYLSGCYDLLDDHNPILIASDYAPRGQSMHRIQSIGDDLIPFLAKVKEHRSVRSTRMNQKTEDCSGSSRSHCALLLTLLQIDSATKFCSKTTFTLVDLAGAERPDKVSDERLSAMEAYFAIQQKQKHGGNGEVPIAAQGVIINFELFEIGTAVLTATDRHRKGLVYAPPKQLSSPIRQFIGSCLDGTSLLSMVVTVSQEPQNGWETWFSMKYGTDLSKLRAPCHRQRPIFLEEALSRARRNVEDATKLLERTPEFGSPASRYHFPRLLELRHSHNQMQLWNQLASLLHSEEDEEEQP